MKTVNLGHEDSEHNHSTSFICSHKLTFGDYDDISINTQNYQGRTCKMDYAVEHRAQLAQINSKLSNNLQLIIILANNIRRGRIVSDFDDHGVNPSNARL